MARVLLDTTVLIDVLRGRSAIEGLRTMRAAGDDGYVCAVSVEEVVRGLRDGEWQAARRLVRGLRIAPLGEAEGWQAGEWRREYATVGVTLTQGDCLVAAAAHTLGARLATGNTKHFPMPELDVEDWPAGE